MDDVLIWQIAGFLVTLAGIITAAPVYFARKNAERLETSNRELFASMRESHKELKDDVKKLTQHIDNRIDKMHQRMDLNNGELKDFITNEVSQLKAKDQDQESKIEKLKDELNYSKQEHLRFRLEVSEKYEKKKN